MNYFKLFKKFILKLSLICLIFVLFGFTEKAKAATDIRVGLECLYKDKQVITIYNTALKMGYSVNNSFRSEVLLKSGSGFSFEPVDKAFFYEENHFSSYSAAYKGLQNRQVDGMNPTIGCCGRKKWRLFYSDGTKMPDNCKKYTGSGLISLTFGRKKILINETEGGNCPQFKAADRTNVLSLGTRKYRGRLEIGRYGRNTLTAVNIVNIENYLKGVVTCEMNSSWETEALKVQAVCARSYAYAKCSFSSDTYLKNPYVINDTDASQVYKGYTAETGAAVTAVKGTAGEVLLSEGKPLIAYYSSTSGGATEFSSDIWGGNSFNYVGVFDEYETEPERKPWCVKFTKNELEKLLNQKGYTGKNIKSIYPEILSNSGRVSSLKVKYETGSVSIPGSKLRSLFDLPSTKFIIVDKENYRDYQVSIIGNETENTAQPSELYVISGSGEVTEITEATDQMIIISDSNMTNFPLEAPAENEICFLGMGSGHGIGMSQSGANGMAKAGYNYRDILSFYYRNSTIGYY